MKSFFVLAAIIIGLNVSAQRNAEFLLDHPNLSSDKVPYWDYNAPVTKDTYRDLSAASIMASALLELGQYCSGDEQNKYVDVAEKIL